MKVWVQSVEEGSTAYSIKESVTDIDDLAEQIQKNNPNIRCDFSDISIRSTRDNVIQLERDKIITGRGDGLGSTRANPFWFAVPPIVQGKASMTS